MKVLIKMKLISLLNKLWNKIGVRLFNIKTIIEISFQLFNYNFYDEIQIIRNVVYLICQYENILYLLNITIFKKNMCWANSMYVSACITKYDIYCTLVMF